MATNLKDTIRATMMGAIPTSISTSGHLFFYSGAAPAKTASPTGTSGITGGIVLSSTMGTVSGGVLTTSGVPLSATATASITPGYYRITDGATDDGTHTQIQGSCGVGSGDINFASTIASGGTVTLTGLTYTEGNA